MTPMIKQYFDLKGSLDSETILFFRMGDFYELFDTDAIKIAPKLNIVLTYRQKSQDTKIPFCGVPFHSYEHYLIKLLKMGFKVAVAEQENNTDFYTSSTANKNSTVSNKSKKKLLSRHITRIHTPSCSEFLSDLTDQNNYLFAIYECPQSRMYYLCISEYSTSRLDLVNFYDLEILKNYINLYHPKEILVRNFQFNKFKEFFKDYSINALNTSNEHSENDAKSVVISRFYEDFVNDEGAEKSLDYLKKTHLFASKTLNDYMMFNKKNLNVIQDIFKFIDKKRKNFQLKPNPKNQINQTDSNNNLKYKENKHIENYKLLLGSLMVYYLKIFAGIAHFKSTNSLIKNKHINLDQKVVRDLELIRSFNSSKIRGSLMSVINCTQTAMGKRLLQSRLLNPFVCPDLIKKSHDIIELLLKSQLITKTSQYLNIYDLERLSYRVKNLKITPKQVINIKSSLETSLPLVTIITELDYYYENYSSFQKKSADNKIKNFISTILKNLKKSKKVYDYINNAIDIIDLETNIYRNIIKIGFNKKLDDLNNSINNIKDQICKYESQLIKKHDITLKIINHRSMGLLIELTKSQLKKAPNEFNLKHSTLNAKRYTTKDLDNLSNQLNKLDQLAIEHEKIVFNDFIQNFNNEFYEDLVLISKAIAEIDLYLSFGYLAKKDNYTKPVINNKNHELILKDSFHPVVHALITDIKYIKNSYILTPPAKQALITGANMAGKSTFMRQIAICAILNQIGCFVPASHAKIPIYDGIFTRIGASDNLIDGKSTFMVEMHETSDILCNSTENSLVIIDELGRGTSTDDGLAIAYAVLSQLCKKNKPTLLFATHFHELAKIADSFDTVQLIRTQIESTNKEVKFTYNFESGICHNSYGLITAKLAGIDSETLLIAKDLLKKIASSSNSKSNLKESRSLEKEIDIKGESKDKSYLDNKYKSKKIDEIITKINEFDPSDCSPIQAMHNLLDLKNILK